jgi:hypothetical protein
MLDEEAVKAEMEAQRREEESAAGTPQNDLAARANIPDSSGRYASQRGAFVPTASSTGQNAIDMPEGTPGLPIRGAIPTGNVSSTHPPEAPSASGAAAPAATVEPPAATEAAEPRSAYPQDTPGTQLALSTEEGQASPAADESSAPGVLATVTAAFGSMSGGDFVRLGVALLVLAFILGAAAFAWRVAYSPKPQRRHQNGGHKAGSGEV